MRSSQSWDTVLQIDWQVYIWIFPLIWGNRSVQYLNLTSFHCNHPDVGSEMITPNYKTEVRQFSSHSGLSYNSGRGDKWTQSNYGIMT
jgi:hypothetical protein